MCLVNTVRPQLDLLGMVHVDCADDEIFAMLTVHGSCLQKYTSADALHQAPILGAQSEERESTLVI